MYAALSQGPVRRTILTVCASISSGYQSSLCPATGRPSATTANEVQCSGGQLRSAWQVNSSLQLRAKRWSKGTLAAAAMPRSCSTAWGT